jgi:hypothetical protein
VTRRLVVAGVLACLAAASLAAGARAATTIRIRFQGPAGERVMLASAKLIVVAWGQADTFDLSVEGDVLPVDLDVAWLRARWPARIDDMDAAFLYVEAAGFVPMRSAPFKWLGSHKGSIVETRITFPRTAGVTIRPGAVSEMRVALRKPEPRALRFVDQNGRPVANVVVDAKMFYSQANHCGVFYPWPGISGLTDAQGRLTIPDGDYEYAISVQGGEVAFEQSVVYDKQTVALTGTETTVPVRRFSRAKVSAQVLENGRPVADATLGVEKMSQYLGCMEYGVRTIVTSAADGRITVDVFRPDELKEVFVCRNGREVWRGRPAALAVQDAKINLVSGYAVENPNVDRCR